MIIKKTASKPFHLGNRLNGNGAKIHAAYGVFENGVQVGTVHCSGGVWDAFDKNLKRINGYGAATLTELKKQLA